MEFITTKRCYEGNCVGVGIADDGDKIHVKNTTPGQDVDEVVFPVLGWEAFLAAAKAGEFDASVLRGKIED